MIVRPVFSSHSQVSSTNASRPMSWRSALLRELLLDDVLRRDPGVVVPRLPERVEAAHPVPADEHVLDRAVQRVPHVELAGHVRRRHADDVRLVAACARSGRVQALRLPGLLPARLDAGRARTGIPWRGSLGRRVAGARQLGAAAPPGYRGQRGASRSRRIPQGSARTPPRRLAVDRRPIGCQWPTIAGSNRRSRAASSRSRRSGLLARRDGAAAATRATGRYVWIAAALTLLIAAVGVLTPWSRLPRWTYIVPRSRTSSSSRSCCEASDGSVSGYAPLALLPVVWIALNLGRREVALGIALGGVGLRPPAARRRSGGVHGERLATGALGDRGRHHRRLLDRVDHARQAIADPDRTRAGADDRGDRRGRAP